MAVCFRVRMVRDLQHFLRQFIVGLLIVLNMGLFVNGIYLDCNECTIHFSNNRVSGVELAEPFSIDINATELYEEFEAGQCLIKFDKSRGFHQ